MRTDDPIIEVWRPLFTLLHVQIRSARPGIVTGMRISMAGAWTSIVAVELMGLTLDASLRGLLRLADPSRRT